MESHQRKHVTRQKNNFFVTLLMMLQAPPNHQRNFQKSLMKNITSSSRSVETDTAIFTLTCIKAQQSGAYAQKVKLTNLKQMAQTVAYIQEHGYDSLDDFHVELNQASDQTSAPRKSLKDTEQQLKDVNEQIEKVKDL